MSASQARSIHLRDLSFLYPQSPEPLFQQLSVSFPVGFTGVVGANGAGKSTLLRLLVGELSPTAGDIEGSGDAIYCEQRTDQPPMRLAEFLEDWSGEACELRGRLAIEADFDERWFSLSYGERKRAQIGCALWQQPDLLALDEPTNHIDAEAVQLLRDALQRFNGVGVIVSHDRALLDALCCQCVWIEPPTAQVFAGGYSQASNDRAVQRTTRQREHNKLRGQQKQLKAELVRRREQASRADAKRSKRGIAAKDSDARDRIDRARVSGKDGQAGKLLRQLDGRSAQGEARLASMSVQREFATGIWLSGEASKRNSLFDVPAGELPLGAERTLSFPALTMQPTDRIALTGANGAGKSTLLAHILAACELPEERQVVLPQELDEKQARYVLAQTRTLPKAQLGSVMTIVSRLGSRPERLLASETPSPGEVRKLLLAVGLAREPHLLVLDEPTNHLDLPSIEALEVALANCPCGLLFVSHDQRFVNRLATRRWQIEVTPSKQSQLTER